MSNGEHFWKTEFKRSMYYLVREAQFKKGNFQRIPKEMIAAIAAELEVMMAAPSRHYHTNQHLNKMVGHLSVAHRDAGTLPSKEYDRAIVATAFHDAIYDAKSDSNEYNSAEFMSRTLSNFLLETDVIFVEKMIRATQAHKDASNYYIQELCDADLAELGADWQTFSDNSDAIAKEFSHISRGELLKGRTKFFEVMLGRLQIFQTNFFHKNFEVKARANMKQAIKEMTFELSFTDPNIEASLEGLEDE